jgi:hypothetical protein
VQHRSRVAADPTRSTPLPRTRVTAGLHGTIDSAFWARGQSACTKRTCSYP